MTGHVKLHKGKRGDTWYLRYRLQDGRQVQKRLGPAWEEKGRPHGGYYTRRTAQDALEELLTDARRGTLEGMRKTGATFADAAAEYLRYVEHERQIDPSTVADYRGVIDGYLIAEFGPYPLEAITADEVDAYKGRLLAEGRLSKRTIVRHLVVIHGIFKRAARAFGLEANPASADLVERPKLVYTGEYRAYDRDQIELLAAAASTVDRQDGALIRTAAYTGLRQGECLALRWRDVDFVTGLIHVRKNYTDRCEKTPKGKRVRSVPMMAQVVDTLARLKEREHFTGDDDLVFCSALGGFLDSWALRRRYYRAIKAAGLPRLTFHDLRHTFGTAAITVLDPHRLQGYMGHQHYSTTARYLHHKPRPEDARALEQAFAGDKRRDKAAAKPLEDQGVRGL